MKTSKIGQIVGMGLLAVAATGCDIDQTREAEMPRVDVDPGQLPKYEVRQTQQARLPDVDVEGGQLPHYDVDTVDIDVETKEVTVKVPDVDVDMEEKTFTVPDIDIEMPDDDRIDDNGK